MLFFRKKMSKYNHAYKFVNCVCVVHMLYCTIILLAVPKASAEAKNLRSPAPDFDKQRIAQPIVHHARTKREITSTKYKYKRSVTDARVHDPFNANKNSRYVELVLVFDHGLYMESQSNKFAVYRYAKDLVNIINTVYAPLNIFIALVGVDVWTLEDKIELRRNSSEILANFLWYSLQDLNLPNDIAFLLTRQDFDGDNMGIAYFNAICTSWSVGIASTHSRVMELVAMTMAHEIGHILGMVHDGEECECADEECIMIRESSDYVRTSWSSCSLRSLNRTLQSGMDRCLRNKPNSLFNPSTCGDGVVDPGEQCDCGTMADPRVFNPCHVCCQPDTCMLRRNATCGAGACCDLQTCRPLSAGTQCRAAASECDLPEYCTGDSEFCTDDVFKIDTTPCEISGERAYCTRGWCRSHLSQCQLLWGPTSQTAHGVCYENNVLGTQDHNCGYDQQRQRYRSCSQQDAVCGLLHCQHGQLLNKNLDPATIWAYKHYQNHIFHDNKFVLCNAVEPPRGSDWKLGLVPDGARCGDDDMICLDQRCVSLDAARATLSVRPCPSNCSDHGVCNSQGRCHCEDGFAPPLCELPGTNTTATNTTITTATNTTITTNTTTTNTTTTVPSD